MQRKYILFSLLAVIFCSSRSMAKDDDASPATLQQIQLIENSIDYTVQPCDNFYKYACGNWDQQKFAGDNNSTNHKILKKNFLQEVKIMLDYDLPEVDDLKIVNQSYTDKLMAFYYSCKNNEKTEVFKNLKPGIGIEWPMIDVLKGNPISNMDNFDVFKFLGQMFSYGLNEFVLSHSVTREKNNSLRIEINMPDADGPGINSIRAFVLLNIGFKLEHNDDIDGFFNDVASLQNDWLQTYKDYSEENSETFSYGQIKQLYPQLSNFLKEMLSHQIDDSDTVVLQNVKYIDFLIAKEWQPQDLRKFCNYAMVHLHKLFMHNNEGNCINLVMKKMHFAVNYIYRQRNITPQIMAAFNDLKEKIYKYLVEDVNENHLELSAEQLKAINDKLARIHISIGNIPDNADDALVEEFYRHLPDMDINNFAQNLWLSMKQRFWEGFNCPAHMECLEDIGFGTYNVPENDLVIISMASMKPFMYDTTFDPILAVSLMGVFIGHEYGHSIDTDALTETLLYGPMHEDYENNPKIKASIECTSQQFQSNNLRQFQVDLLGARAAYRMYEIEYKSLQPSFTDIPWQQLFYLNFAQFFCEWMPDDDRTYEHISRTNHVAVNMDEFGKAFNCPDDWYARKTCSLY